MTDVIWEVGMPYRFKNPLSDGEASHMKYITVPLFFQ
jgi:hypothetical protein